jgi:cyclopropane fatty-acyl-phospholipid synthase-like methyltransferase
MRDHFNWFAKYTDDMYTSTTGYHAQAVLDIGCNDGSQLDQYKAIGFSTFGVDPASNLYKTSSEKHRVWCDYFDMKFVEKNRMTFDIIVAQNVFAHNYNPSEFLMAVRNCMEDRSLLFVQTSQANMIQNNEFDTIYHEHISFYNINSMNELCKRMNMSLIDVTKCPLHGTSYIFVISKNSSLYRPEHIAKLIKEEKMLYDPLTYDLYAKKCKELIHELQNEVGLFSRLEVGFHVVGYGAAAKGMTLLNASKIKLDFIVDDNPLKQDHFTPGSSIPIVSSSKLDELKDPILFIPLAWNFFDEIKKRIKEKRDNKHDRFLLYFPSIRVEE